ncbi:unnamed protein product, partial [Staurois parvus]
MKKLSFIFTTPFLTLQRQQTEQTLYRLLHSVGSSAYQGRTDNSWGPWAIGDHGTPVSLPKLKKAYEKGTRGISWGPLLTPGPRAVSFQMVSPPLVPIK